MEISICEVCVCVLSYLCRLFHVSPISHVDHMTGEIKTFIRLPEQTSPCPSLSMFMFLKGLIIFHSILTTFQLLVSYSVCVFVYVVFLPVFIFFSRLRIFRSCF